MTRLLKSGHSYLKKEGKFYKVEEELNVLIKQDFKLDDKIVEITGITDELLDREGISEEEAFNRFKLLHKKVPYWSPII